MRSMGLVTELQCQRGMGESCKESMPSVFEMTGIH